LLQEVVVGEDVSSTCSKHGCGMTWLWNLDYVQVTNPDPATLAHYDNFSWC